MLHPRRSPNSRQADFRPASPLPPGGFSASEVPQFICIGFDDNQLSGQPESGGEGGLAWAYELFAGRKNPMGSGNPGTFDGTPARASFFHTAQAIAEHLFEDPKYVRRGLAQLQRAGHEIGNHSYRHPHGGDFDFRAWYLELDACERQLCDAQIDTSDDGSLELTREQLRGFRTPYLEYNAAALESAYRLGYEYDCSIEEGWQEQDGGRRYNWPYTLDQGSPGHDFIVYRDVRSPIGRYAGMWEMPGYPVVVPPDERCSAYGILPGLRTRLRERCSVFDISVGKITGFDWNLWWPFQMRRAEFVATLRYTLDQRLAGNRAHFLFGAHSDYYNTLYPDPPVESMHERRAAMKDFLDYALQDPRVRVVTLGQLLDWMRHPSSLSFQATP